MKKLVLTATILLCAVPSAYARDAALEAADVMFYDKNCAKLPADFVNSKIKEATGGATAVGGTVACDEPDAEPAWGA
jgi:hypothetical protein